MAAASPEKDEYMTVKQAADAWGISATLIYGMIQDGKIPGVIRCKKNYFIPAWFNPNVKKKSYKQKNAIEPKNYMSPVQASEKWGICLREVYRLISEGRIPGSIKAGRLHLIPSDLDCPPINHKSY